MKRKRERSDFKFKKSNPVLNKIKLEYQNVRANSCVQGWELGLLTNGWKLVGLVDEKLETLFLSPVFLSVFLSKDKGYRIK